MAVFVVPDLDTVWEVIFPYLTRMEQNRNEVKSTSRVLGRCYLRSECFSAGASCGVSLS